MFNPNPLILGQQGSVIRPNPIQLEHNAGGYNEIYYWWVADPDLTENPHSPSLDELIIRDTNVTFSTPVAGGALANGFYDSPSDSGLIAGTPAGDTSMPALNQNHVRFWVVTGLYTDAAANTGNISQIRINYKDSSNYVELLLYKWTNVFYIYLRDRTAGTLTERGTEVSSSVDTTEDAVFKLTMYDGGYNVGGWVEMWPRANTETNFFHAESIWGNTSARANYTETAWQVISGGGVPMGQYNSVMVYDATRGTV